MTVRWAHPYRNLPGEHCGSTAMRNLVFHYGGLELSEEEIFGLGSGLDCVLIRNDAITPGILLFGRSASMETDCTTALGIDYREQIEPDDRRAWEVVKAEVEDGRPTMLSGDALYLDYRDFRVHFPSHRFVLVGFDDQERIAYVADRIDPGPQKCSYDALTASRNPKDFLSTYNLWGRFVDPEPKRTLAEAYEHAIRINAARMVDRADADRQKRERLEQLGTPQAGRGLEISTGLAALAELDGALASLPDHPRGKEIARYAASCIETFGTGGGNFRTLYARFLARAREHVPALVDATAPELAGASSKLWTALSAELSRFAKSDDAFDPSAARALLARIHQTEARLFEPLAAAPRT